MAPEYGATIGFFPIDHQTLDYLRLTNRSPEQIALVEAYAKAQGLFLTPESADPEYSDTLELDLGTVVPSMAGPKRPQDRINLPDVKKNFLDTLERRAKVGRDRDQRIEIHHSRRLRGYRRHHQLHQHLESLGHDRRRSAREEGRREGTENQALGKVEPRARLQSCHRLSERRRPDAVSRKAAIQPGRLRLHHLHRQQRTAARAGRRRGAKGEAHRRRRAERQSQLRRPHQFAGARELSRLAAAGGRLRAGRPRRHRSAARAARFGPQRQRRFPQGHLAVHRRSAGRGASARCAPKCSTSSTRKSSRATSAGTR